MAKQISEDVKRSLKSLYEVCQKEDIATRERQLRVYRRLKLLWEGFNRVWYSEVAHDWRIWDEQEEENTEQAYYDKPINVFKAYLESIIAALSITIPPVKCYPDDADNPLDLATAKAGDKIGQLVYRHNDVALLWLHSLFIFCTEGMVACYAYPKEDEKYGTYESKEYDDIEEEHQTSNCPNCGYEINSQLMNPDDVRINDLVSQELDEFMPDDDDVEIQNALLKGQDVCPACAQLMDPEIRTQKFIVTRLIGYTKSPKTRICTEVYGGLNVKVGIYAKCQEQTPYLIFSEEVDASCAATEYEDYLPKRDRRGFIEKVATSGKSAGGYTQYEQWARLSPQYRGTYPDSVVTVSKIWIRPGKYNYLPEADAKELKRLYPNGVKAVFVNDDFITACNESLDDCWTINYNPLSDYLYFEPLGQALVPVQDITNDLISLVLQTIEHGIGQTFADPSVLDFNAYQQAEALPGGVYPAKAKSGTSVADGFHQIKTATLSAEVLPFQQNIQGMGQLVTGALPSLFGGAIEGSETASQYSMSRAQALQRLQNTWKMFTIWWKNIFGKVIPMYLKEVQEQGGERDVQLDSAGNFVNMLITRADLDGKLGKIELEATENLPLTWAQKNDIVTKLMQNPNPIIVQMLTSPTNLPLLHEALGLVDFNVPGEEDVIRQHEEIKMLLHSDPIPNPMDATGQLPELPSVEIDPVYDMHPIHFETIRQWVISEAGQQAKVQYPDGYKNVLLHGKMHYLQISVTQQQSNMANGNGNGAVPPRKSKETEQEAPIMGDNNVATVQ